MDYLCAGTVQQEVRLSNVAKEAGFEAKLPKGIPGHTVTMACISSNQVKHWTGYKVNYKSYKLIQILTRIKIL